MKRFLFILMAAVMLMGGTVTAFASEYPSDLPPLPSHQNGEYNLVYADGKYWLHVSATDGENDTQFVWNTDGTFYVRSTTQPFMVILYTYEPNVDSGWEHTGGGQLFQPDTNSFSYARIISRNAEIIYSTLNVYDYHTGEKVFQGPPTPLAETIQEVAEETLNLTTMPKLTKTVLVVVLCGVGCLALLISLPLLSKTLRIFLKH